MLAESPCWIALQVSEGLILISLYSPHLGRPFREFAECLISLEEFLKTNTVRHYCLGMEANVQVSGIVDHLHVGDSVFRRSDGSKRESATTSGVFIKT